MADLPKGYLLDNPEPEIPKGYALDKPVAQFQSPILTDNTIGRHLVEAAPYLGGVAGSFLAGGPGLGTTAGIGLVTVIKQALQKASPALLWEAPSGAVEIGAD